MKETREAGEEDEASAQLAFFSSAEALTPAAVVTLILRVCFGLVGFVLPQTWLLLPVSAFYTEGSGRDSDLCRNAGRKDFR